MQPPAEVGGAQAEPVLELRAVFQHVGMQCALDQISLRVAAGENLLIIGPNGAGKSLLTRLILGLDRPSAGEVRLFGSDLARLSEARLRRLRQRIGAVLQGGALLDGLSVLENLLLPLRAAGVGRAQMARSARLIMTLLHLDGMENHRTRGLSLGQRRRVELARALIHRPELLVWDGLTDGLDPPAVRDIAEALRIHHEGRELTIIATDNSTLDLVRDQDRVAVLNRGRLVFDGSRAELTAALPTNLELRCVLEGQP